MRERERQSNKSQRISSRRAESNFSGEGSRGLSYGTICLLVMRIHNFIKIKINYMIDKEPN